MSAHLRQQLSSDVSNHINIITAHGDNTPIGNDLKISYDLIVGKNVRIGVNSKLTFFINYNNNVQLSPDIQIYATIVIEDNVHIGNNVNISVKLYFEDNVIIGTNAIFGAGIKIESGSHISRNVIICSSMTIKKTATVADTHQLILITIRKDSMIRKATVLAEIICEPQDHVLPPNNIEITIPNLYNQNYEYSHKA